VNVLAFDTATQYLSLALHSDKDCLQRQLMLETGHAKILFSEIDALLASAGMTIDDVDLLGVGNGPGSFTGVRVGVSAAQAIAYARSIPVIGVSSLAAIAAQANTECALAVMDARMDEVYAGYYRTVAGQPCLIGQESVLPAGDLVLPDARSSDHDWSSQTWSLVALGWSVFGDRLLQALAETRPVEVLEDVQPSASVIASVARARLESGDSGDWLELVPSYVRNQVAKVASRA